jgi:hypothetical protein
LHKSEKRRSWKVVLEENRKLVQRIDDHPGTEKTQIQTGATEDCSLVPTGKKLTLVREVTEGLYRREGTPCAEEIQWEGYLINLWKS